MNDVINLLKSHRSVRKYTSEPIAEEKLKLIIEAAQCASSSNFVQAYTIIKVDDRKKREEITKLAGNQKYIGECPVFLVFCADLNRHKVACEMNKVNMAEGYTESFIIATVDTALAAQNSMIAAESMGLGGVYIGGIRNNPEKIVEILNLPLNVYPVFGMCLGYPDERNETKERLPLDIVLKKEEYGSNDEENLRKYDEKVKQYYIERTNGERSDTWTGTVSNMFSSPLRPHMKEFLDKQGFSMK